MQIHIDTQKDSPDEIKRIIDFLQSTISTQSSSLINDEAQTPSGDMFNMFSDDTSTQNESEQPINQINEATSQAQPSMFDMFGDNSSSTETTINLDEDEDSEEEKQSSDDVKIIPYD